MKENSDITLDLVELENHCVVTKVDKNSNTQLNRMYDFGIVKGAVILPLNNSMSGNTRAYLIKGSVIALRQQDAQKVKVSI